ncbi:MULTISPECIES: SRPBCC family protein [Haloarcula]|uniref:Polyketide cyclase n=1 Tax=Haloarcula pellucida TaxID=1427151 RepID=A0A830GIY1_9EURY|nr:MULTISPECIES: SRPBCC family protein [Halomicroarcula]MBX0347591.1 SRPBCC family protein [Halomicroarcula pellucida]MDS0276487.1 SRPBCC family protein [Halomicroarcula sp. S1AR25-4]GGN89438.1 polyketide cyclase [Halomicroarcula pellucida]
MTVRVERSMTVSAPPERVWAFIADPDQRARPISVVKDWEVTNDEEATWHISLPIPIIDRTIRIETRDVERREPEYVRFVGRSRVMQVQGEHELEPTESGGTKLTNRFVVDGKLPGVERFFKRNLDGEMENLEQALRDYLEVEV